MKTFKEYQQRKAEEKRKAKLPTRPVPKAPA